MYLQRDSCYRPQFDHRFCISEYDSVPKGSFSTTNLKCNYTNNYQQISFSTQWHGSPRMYGGMGGMM
mgnify:FL=1